MGPRGPQADRHQQCRYRADRHAGKQCQATDRFRREHAIGEPSGQPDRTEELGRARQGEYEELEIDAVRQEDGGQADAQGQGGRVVRE